MSIVHEINPARRSVLKLVGLAGGGLVLEGALPAAVFAGGPKSAPVPAAPVGYFIEIHPDNTVTFVLTRHEMGQGVATAMAMIVAEELGADWPRMKVRVPDTSEARYSQIGTGGSTTIKDSYLPLRRAGALAREALISVAAKAWRVAPAECSTAAGHVTGPGGKKIAFGQLATEAAKLGAPENLAAFRALQPALRRLEKPQLLGQGKTNMFADAIVRGQQRYGIDVRIPGMLYASVERSPQKGGKVKRFDATRALQVPGVRKVFKIDGMADPMRTVAAPATFSSSKEGVAVVADSTWAAMQGRRALAVEWEAPAGPAHEDASWRAEVVRLLENEAKTVAETGTAPAGREGEYFHADYIYPYQAHACMEPMNCVAHFKGDGAELWLSTQGAGGVRGRIADLWKFKPENVVVHGEFSGGGFGRRFYNDVPVEALRISEAAGGVPVKVVWTREDDLRHDHFHPYYHGRFSALVEKDGTLASFRHTEARAYWGDPANEVIWFMYDANHMRYAFANAQSASPLQCGAWRSVVANNWAFGQECFIDELALKANIDALEMRRKLLASGTDKKAGNRFTMSTARLQGVLDMLAIKADWGKAAPAIAGHRVGRGVAAFPYMHGDSYCAMAIDVAIDSQNRIRVTRVVAAVDCGQVINPDGARQQMEGGILWGLSAALHGGVTLEKGAVANSNYHDTPILRHSESPPKSAFEIHFVQEANRAPTGLGEIAPPLVAPALCNAIFAATGQRVRQLPVVLRA